MGLVSGVLMGFIVFRQIDQILFEGISVIGLVFAYRQFYYTIYDIKSFI